MCLKKDNYYETLSWIEDLIDACNTIEEDTKIEKIIDDFYKTLANDNGVSPMIFDIFINRINHKSNQNLIHIISEIEVNK